MSDRIEIKPDGSWIFHGEDSRLRDPGKNEVTNYRVWNPLEKKFEYRVMHRVYCLNCGADGGLTARTALYVKYICDKCFEVQQPADFIPMLPEEEVRWRHGLPSLEKEQKSVTE